MSQAEETQAAESAVRHRKERQGVVVSAKSEKTVVVSVSRRVKHPRYKKYVTRRKRYTAHDLIGCQEGDVVRIRETRPLSKTKRWQVAERIESRG